MDEYEKLEEELQILYDSYVIKFRCLVYLDQQLEDLEKAEFDQIQVNINFICCHHLSVLIISLTFIIIINSSNRLAKNRFVK